MFFSVTIGWDVTMQILTSVKSTASPTATSTIVVSRFATKCWEKSALQKTINILVESVVHLSFALTTFAMEFRRTMKYWTLKIMYCLFRSWTRNGINFHILGHSFHLWIILMKTLTKIITTCNLCNF